MLNRHSKVYYLFLGSAKYLCLFLVLRFILMRQADVRFLVIARNALAQEESEEFSGDFSDPINIHIENDRDGCPC